MKQLPLNEMEDSNTRNGRKKLARNPYKIGVIRVFSNPGPDAEDRLRRLFSLLVKYATRDGHAASEKDSPPCAPGIADHPEGEA